LRRTILGFATAFLVFGIAAQASALQYVLNDSFGSDPVSGDIVIDITDGVGDSVQVSIDLTGLNSVEYIKELYLNTNTEVQPALSSASAPTSLDDVSYGLGAFKADGDGFHDLLLEFSPDAGARMTGGAVYTLTLSGSGLDASDFDDLGTDSPKGQFHAVAKINSTGTGGGSDWVGDGGDPIPEPSGVVLFSAGMAVVATSMRRRRG
jgi:hypothetical protein